MANMVRSHHLAKSIADAGWRAFQTILASKLTLLGSEWLG
jgi:transposase